MKAFKLKKIVACLLVILLLTNTGVSAIAAPYGSTGDTQKRAVNNELMQFLEEEYGAEHADSMFQTINDLGLVDANGQFLNHPISLDGKKYTLEKIKKLIADEKTDLTQMAEVDGEKISLDALKKIINIESQLEALKQLAETEETDNVSITPEHLDKLDSLITQANDEGLGFYDEEGNLLAGESNDSDEAKAGGSGLSAVVEGEDYGDETVVTVTNYDFHTIYGYDSENYGNRGYIRTVTLTFQLNKPQSEAVSFSYELMDGTLNSLFDKRPLSGTVTFEPGDVVQTLEIRGDETNSAQPKKMSAKNYRETVWANFARADYIHFENFENLDSIRFNMKITDSSKNKDLTISPFTHSYDGGAYLAYSTQKGNSGGSNPQDIKSNIFKYAIESGIPDFYINTREEILEVNAREGNYTTGQIIPISVLFSNFVQHKMPKETPENNPVLQLANGDVATPAIITAPSLTEPTISFLLGYQMTVKKDTTLDGIKVMKSSGEGNPKYYDHPPANKPVEIFAHVVYPDSEWGKDFTNNPNITLSHARSDAFQSLELDKSSYIVGDTAKVTVNLETVDGMADWIIDGATTPEDISKRLKVSFGDKEQGLIDLDWKLGEDNLPVQPLVLEGNYEITEDIVNLMSDSNKADGKLRAKIYYNRVPLGDGEDLKDFGLLSDTFAYFTIDKVKYITPNDLAITYPTTWPSDKENVVLITSPVPTKLGFTYPEDATYITPDQFEWKSTDETIATINADGTIIPKQAGLVTFTLIAKNGGKLMPQTEITSEEIEINSDGVIAVVVPDFANRVYASKNKEATILWTTNVMNKYKELALPGKDPADANFEIEFYTGFWDEAQIAAQTPTKTWAAPATKELINATSFTIPQEYMKDISTQNTPSYTVRISTKDPETPAKTLSALSYVVVNSEAAAITLDKSMGQFATDNINSLALKWDLQNFDLVNKGDFEFKVTKNGTLIPDSLMTFDASTEKFSSSSATETGGSYSLKIDPVVNTGSIKDVYAITLAAKNSLDSTWSYDSLYLQVYKTDALQIQIDGQSKTAHTMSNIDKIKNMTNDERIALKRDISLKNDMSINNKDYNDLGEITDQIVWKSSNNDAGVINFKSNGGIEDIEKDNYASYQPKHSFILSGIENGKTTITATHAKTGIEAELNVTVETLKDKLYLFQFYPKTATTITYTNKDGAEKSVTSNADGELALYDENGIASDVYVTSKFKNTTYTGVLNHETLLSKEKDPASLELYPINMLQLRQLSKVEMYFKKPNGQPYTGEVTYRGGVYKNDNYAEPAEISGKGITKTLGADGKLDVIFDTTDFYSKAAGETNAADLSAKDQIDIIFEVMFENDQYIPQILMLDGNSNAVDMITFGEKISNLIENPTSQKAPVIVNQFVTDDRNNEKAPILTYTGKFGPSNQFPNVKMTTEFMWWGEQVDDEAFVELHNEVGFKPQGQSYQTIKYPFTDSVITRHEQVLNEDTIWLDKAESGSIHFKLFDKPDSFRKSFTSAASLVNMIGVQEISQKELSDEIKKLKEDLENTDGSTKELSNDDKAVKDSLEMMSKIKMDVGPLSMKVIPTDDPLVYKTIMSASLGGIPKTQGGSAAGGSSNVEFLKNKKSSFIPGLGDVKKMANDTYLAEQKQIKENARVKKTNSAGSVMYSAGGYYVGEIKYNTKSDKWEAVVHGGGFNAGGGFEFSQSWNMAVGFVPVTFSLTIGGGVEIGAQASVLFDEVPGDNWKNTEYSSVNDYLVSYRIIAYIEMFGGVGFDYSVVAAKIGVFGRVSIENTSTWLKRDYLASSKDQIIFGNKLTLEGVAGVRVVLKFLFISIKHDFATLRYSHSWVYNNWKGIQDYWDKHGNSPLTAENLDLAIAAYMDSIGEDPMQVIESKTMEDRDYLGEHERSWQEPAGMMRGVLGLDPDNAAPTELQTNAYPYADPKVVQDGSLFVYLSDGNSTAIEDTVASWAVKSGNGYVDKGEITTDAALKGYGDTGLQVAGEGNEIAAVWVTQKEKITKEAGEEVTNKDILLMNNSTEIMTSIYNGNNWDTHQLTTNTSPDLAPVVSIGNDKVFVAYRSVYSSNTENPLDFSESDSILYTVYDMKTKMWSDVETLYNGTNGTVMGLSTETLSDGATAVVYNVNKGNEKNTLADDYVAGTDNEIIYAVINTDDGADAAATTWKTKGVVKNLQVTKDDNANENPQLTSAKFADGVERFIMAWYTTSEETGIVDQDIKLFVINKDGEVYTEFVDSLNALSAYNDVKIHPNFTFAKMPNANKKVENLSILWKEAEVDISPQEIITRDTVKAVKFGIDDHEVYLSGAIDVATMPDFTEIDSIDAYVSNGNGTEIKALILGTTYTTDTKEVGTITPKTGDGDDIPVNISKTVSGMYTATETYTNKFNADEIILTPTDIVSGYDMPIQFNLVNQGLNKIDTVEIEVGGQKTKYEDISLFPNNSRALTAPYAVPASIKDIDYTVTVTFLDQEKLSTTGKLKLDIPDIGISEVKIMKEEGGTRTLSVPIYNKNDTTLENKNRVVKFGLYKEPIYTDDNLIGKAIEISSNDELNLIDNGGYTKEVEFSIKDYLTTLDLTEIPDKGITVYLHSWVEDENQSVMTEFDESNNDANVVFDNLSVKHNNNNILLTLEQTNTESNSSVNLSMQNMNMASVSAGNVLLNLLDDKGDIIESKYAATTSSQLLAFSEEEKKNQIVQFSKKGDDVQAIFFKENADNMDSTLSSITLSGIKVDFDSAKTAFQLDAKDLKHTEILATASNSQSTVSLVDKSGKVISSNKGFVSIQQDLVFSPKGTLNEFSIRVEPESTSSKATDYTFAITNKKLATPNLELTAQGEKNQDGTYSGDVKVSLSPYDVTGFAIKKASYKVNDGNWIEIAYDGKAEHTLETLSKEDDYTIVAKVVLTSGLEYVLDTMTFKIVTQTDSGGTETDPGGSETDPGDTETDPGGSETDPGDTETDPGGSETDPSYTIIKKEGTYPETKIWTVKLSNTVDVSTMQDALYLTDAQGNRIPISFTSDGKNIVVQPPKGNYAEGTYTLYITSKLKDKKGNPLKEPIKMIFMIKAVEEPKIDETYKTIEKKGMFPSDKTWTVKLSTEIDESTIEGALFVYDEKGKGVPTTFTGKGKTIIIKAPVDGYTAGTYKVYITNKLKNKKGQPLKEPIKMTFTIKPSK